MSPPEKKPPQKPQKKKNEYQKNHPKESAGRTGILSF
jgi:hypothetical protein